MDRQGNHENHEYGSAWKLSRNPKQSPYRSRTNKRILGISIDQRPSEIDDRQTFSHWEIDTVVGNKVKTDSVLLTLVERQTRFEIILKLKGKDKESLDHAISKLPQRAGDTFSTVFKPSLLIMDMSLPAFTRRFKGLWMYTSAALMPHGKEVPVRTSTNYSSLYSKRDSYRSIKWNPLFKNPTMDEWLST